MSSVTNQPTNLLPSNFLKHPYDSIFQEFKHEVIARNIMVILSRTGNQWRELSWAEYKAERLKDGEFSDIEKGNFDDVSKYCQSAQQALKFCSHWSKG